MNPLPEFRVDPNKKKTGAKILLLLGVYGRCVAAVDFSPQTFLFIGKAVVTDDTPIVNYTEYALVDVLPFKEKHEV